MLLHVHRALHAVIDRQRNHGINYRVLAKWLRLAGGDHLHSGTVVGKLEGDRQATLGILDLMREDFIPADRSRGIFFDQDWASLPGVMPAASGGIHVWHMPALVYDLRRRFDPAVRRRLGRATRREARAGAHANRVALEACVQARNEGRELEVEGVEILKRAAAQLARAGRRARDLARDHLRVRHRRHPRPRRTHDQLRLETFSYLPELTLEQIEAQIRSTVERGLVVGFEYTDDPDPYDHYWTLWKLPLVRRHPIRRSCSPRLEECRAANPDAYIRVNGYDSRAPGSGGLVRRSAA